jgi:hypothetical protein
LSLVRPLDVSVPEARSDRSTVVRWDVVPQPTIAFGLAVGRALVPLVRGGFGKRIAENLVN